MTTLIDELGKHSGLVATKIVPSELLADEQLVIAVVLDTFREVLERQLVEMDGGGDAPIGILSIP